MITQLPFNKQKVTTDSLQQVRDALEQTNAQLVHVNTILELTYTWMRENRA